MAAFSPDTSGSPSAERFRLLRELGSRAVPAWAALESLSDGRKQLVVVERVARGGPFDDQAIGDWVRDARRLATLEHPNVARVRDVVIRSEDVLVASEFVDGVRWSELAASTDRPSLEITLRVLVDVLSGLGAIHNLRDAKRQPLKLVHGELTPEHVIVGSDGVARIVGACRAGSTTSRRGVAGSAYLAPEVLLADDSADARADVYSVGAMLWEALTGRALFPNLSPSAIVTQLLSGRVPKATAPEGTPWAAPLVEVVGRALSADPAQRFESAAAMAAELRRIAGPKLVPAVRVAGLVRAAFGDAIRMRREELERGEVRPPRDVSGIDPAPSASIEVEIETGRPSTVPTPVPPSIVSTKPPPPLEAEAPPKAPPPPPRPQPKTAAANAAPEPPRPAPPAPPKKPAVATATPAPAAVLPAVPAPPRVPADLAVAAREVLEPPPKPVDAAPASPAPSTPASVVESPAGVPTPRKKRGLVAALLVGPIVLALVVGLWSLSSSHAGESTSAHASATAATRAPGTATTSPVATATSTSSSPSTARSVASAAAPTPPTTSAAPDTAAPSATAAPTQTAAAAATATEAPAATTTPAANNAAPAWNAPAPANPQPAPARPAGKRKYEPEGI